MSFAAASGQVAECGVVEHWYVAIEEHANRPQDFTCAVASLLAEMRMLYARDLAASSLMRDKVTHELV